MIHYLKYIRSKPAIKADIDSYIVWREGRWPHGSHEIHRTILWELFNFTRGPTLTPDMIAKFLDTINSTYLRETSRTTIKHFISQIDEYKGVVYIEDMEKKKLPEELRQMFVEYGKLGQANFKRKYTLEQRRAIRQKAANTRWNKKKKLSTT